MSSLTTISSSMEAESPEEVVDTRLSLVIGAGSRPPPVQALLPPDDQAPVRKKGESIRGTSNITTSKPSKRAKTMNGDDDGGDSTSGGARKKLRLTTEQAALLEDSFRAHNVLSHGEKHDLARRLRLSARQVEVWFQNRRARTKLKQTEVDCELLRRWCERLSDENARLRRDIAEARSSSAAVSRVITMVNDVACSTSCNKLAGGGRMARPNRF